MYPRKVPQLPILCAGNEHKVSPSLIPLWMSPLISRILMGEENGEGINHISCNAEGDLEFYRRITDGDRKNYPQLEGVAEVWVTCDLPSTSLD